MTNLTIYDPAMCCSTGICGAEIDQTLVTFAADLDWLKSKGITVTRFNLSQEPGEFAANEAVKSVLQNDGVDGLPVIMKGDEMLSFGRYPARDELEKMAGVANSPAHGEITETANNGGCGCGDSDVEKTSTGCC